MRIEVGVASDVGRVREGNEDAYLVEPPLYAVADGMGGHRGGDVASQLALDTIRELAEQGKGTLGEQVREANRLVFERASDDPRLQGMGTTLTAAVISEGGAHLAHVGDSRAYLSRAGALRRLTEDHTLVNRMVRAGEISSSEAEHHPHRNVLIRVVGTESDVDVDEDSIGLIDGDRLILCSDGLTGMVTEEQIQAISESTPAAQEAADRLVRTANRAGGIDNITVVVLDVVGDEEGASADRDDRRGTIAGRLRGTRRAPDRNALARIAPRAGIALVVLVALLFGLRAFVESQWYVGEADGSVAIYQGIPAEVLGFQLSHVEVLTELDAADVMALPSYADLANGLTAASREEADQIVEEMRRTLEARATARDEGAGS